MDPSSSNSSNGIVGRSVLQQSNDALVELNPSHDQTCMFCDKKEINEKLYGLLYELNGIILHSFCNLFSSTAVQNDSDNGEILIRPFFKFLFKDVQTKLLRGSRETCTYCKNPGATISCSIPRCRKIFHLPCGLNNGSMHQFFEPFKSFCPQHRITQNIDAEYLQNSDPIKCYFCKTDVMPYPTSSSIWAPCCKRNNWFHRDCIQDMALNAGHRFKCPLCNDIDVFKNRMLTLGIYIPLREAACEFKAYLEPVKSHVACEVDVCLCPNSNTRSHHGTGPWEMILCHACSKHATHILCSFLKVNENWFCEICIDKDKKKKAAIARNRQLEITGNLSYHTSTGESLTSSQTSTVIQNNIREIPMNLTTRERTIHDGNNRVMLRNNMGAPQRIIDTITLSSDDEEDPMIVSITHERNPGPYSIIEQHRRIVYNEPSNSLIPQQPMLGSYTSMSTPSTSNGNGYHLQITPSTSQTRNGSNHSNEIVDLTSDDE